MTSPYSMSDADATSPLRQCEILTNVVRFEVPLRELLAASPQVQRPVLPIAIVLTQDCDLEQDFNVRFAKPNPASDKLLPTVLLAEVFTAEQLFASVADSSRKFWDRLNIQENKNERF